MRISLPTPDRAHIQRSAELKKLIVEFEKKNGPVKTSDIVRRCINGGQFNGKKTGSAHAPKRTKKTEAA